MTTNLTEELGPWGVYHDGNDWFVARSQAEAHERYLAFYGGEAELYCLDEFPMERLPDDERICIRMESDTLDNDELVCQSAEDWANEEQYRTGSGFLASMDY